MRSCKRKDGPLLYHQQLISLQSRNVYQAQLTKNFASANFNPSMPCGRPFGNVLSKKSLVTVCGISSSLPVSQNA